MLSPKIVYKLRNRTEYVEKYLVDYALNEYFFPKTIVAFRKNWEALPKYAQDGIPAEILTYIHSHLIEEELQAPLNAYWINRGIQTLENYAACPLPMSKDKRINAENRNLLSKAGKTVLLRLKKALAENRITPDYVQDAVHASNKYLLNLNLFINLNYLKECDFFKNEIPMSSNCTYNAVDGCFNHCSHCGYEASSLVSYMPYPLLLKLQQTLQGLNVNRTLFYANSDLLFYQDPYINADGGDVVRYMTHRGLNMTFPTKGVLLGHAKEKMPWDSIALAKAAEVTDLSFSYVNLPGENTEQNRNRILNSLRVIESISPARRLDRTLEVRMISLTQMEGEWDFLKQSALYSSVEKKHIAPKYVGRWVETCRKYGLTEAVDRKAGSEFADDGIIIRSNGDVYDVSFNSSTQRFDWLKIGSVFNPKIVRIKKRNLPFAKKQPTLTGWSFERS